MNIYFHYTIHILFYWHFFKFHLKFMLINNIVTYSFMLLRLDSPLFYLSQWSVTWCLRDQTVTPHQGKRAGCWLSWSHLKPNSDERIRPGPHHKIFQILTDTEYGRVLTHTQFCSVVWLKSWKHGIFSPTVFRSKRQSTQCMLLSTGFSLHKNIWPKIFRAACINSYYRKSYNYRTIRIIWTFMWL